MDKYTIYCTEEQIKKALKLGAPIETYKPIIINSKAGGSFTTPTIETVTAEQMIGWLEEKGIMINLNHQLDGYCLISVMTEKEIINKNGSIYREVAINAAIDAALDYLTENKK